MVYYIVDENYKPRPVIWEDLIAWRDSLPEDVATSLGYSVSCDYFDKYMVSTIFIPVDHGTDSSNPVLWETMVFKDGRSVDMRRYTSHKAAVQGHREFCDVYDSKIEEYDE